MDVTDGTTASAPDTHTFKRSRSRLFEARFEWEPVDGGDVRQEGKAQRGLRREKLCGAQEEFTVHYGSRFAREFNHFFDGLRIPLAELMYNHTLVVFPGFHCLSDSGWAIIRSSRERPFSRGKCNLPAES